LTPSYANELSAILVDIQTLLTSVTLSDSAYYFDIMPVLCAVFNCGHNATRDKDYSYFRFPKVITNQGEKTQELTEKRRKKWIANISRADLTEEKLQHTRVCSSHFITGKLMQKF